MSKIEIFTISLFNNWLGNISLSISINLCATMLGLTNAGF